MTRTGLAALVLLLGASGLEAQAPAPARPLRTCAPECRLIERPAARPLTKPVRRAGVPAPVAAPARAAASKSAREPTRAAASKSAREPTRAAASEPARDAANAASRNEVTQASTPSPRDLQRLSLRRSGTTVGLPELPATAEPRGVSVTMKPSATGGHGDDGGRGDRRDRDRRDHDRRDRDRHHDRYGYGYGWGYGRNYDSGFGGVEIGLEIADIGLHGLRDDLLVGTWVESAGGAADVIAAELPADRIEVGADGSFLWGEARGSAREIVPHFARGGDRFFLIRENGEEYVIMIDADGEARMLDGLDAIRRGDHLR